MAPEDRPRRSGRRASRSVSREESDLFRRAMKDATPLAETDAGLPDAPPPPPSAAGQTRTGGRRGRPEPAIFPS